MITKQIELNVWDNNCENIYANQGEVDSRYIEVFFKDTANHNINLSGKSVTFYARKPDNTQVYSSCTVNTLKNTATVELTSQVLSKVGVVDCEFQIFDNQDLLLKVNGLQILVCKTLDFSDAIESTSEYNTLIDALNQANTYSQSIGDLSTLTTTNKSSLISAINEVNSTLSTINEKTTVTTLYSNSNGTSNTISLSNKYSDYSVIKIYFGDNGAYNTAELITSSGSMVALASTYSNAASTVFFCHSCLLSFSNKSATFSRNTLTSITGSNISITNMSSGGISVYKILGFKY